MDKIDGKSKKIIISVAVCGALIIIVGIFVAKTIFFNGPEKPVNVIDISTDNKTPTEPAIVNTATPDNKNTAEKVIDFKTAKVGEKYGDMVVSKVNRFTSNCEEITILNFDSEVGISGTYRSEFEDNSREYITLILDEESRRKVPVESIIIDPIGPKNRNALDMFGKTGTTGSFNLIISGFTVTNQYNYITKQYYCYSCKADLEKVNEIKKDEISKWVTDEMMQFSGINSIAFNGKNKYVTVGNYGIIKTSKDLIKWDNCRSPAITYLYDVIWAKGKFITVEAKLSDLIPANIYASDDGEKWTRVYSGESFNRGSFACDGNIIVFVSGTTVITSTDGLNWVERKVDNLEEVEQIFYDGKRFIAYSNEKVFASTDGVNWSLLTDYIGLGMKFLNGEHFNIYEILWNGKEYVGIGSSGAHDAKFIVINSKDGVTWKSRVCNPGFCPSRIAWNGKRYVVTGDLINDYEGSVKMVTSLNRKNWTQISIKDPIRTLFDDIIWDGSQFVAVGSNRSPILENNGHAAIVFKSRDGVNWIQTY